jgi:hypothetical protein
MPGQKSELVMYLGNPAKVGIVINCNQLQRIGISQPAMVTATSFLATDRLFI